MRVFASPRIRLTLEGLGGWGKVGAVCWALVWYLQIKVEMILRPTTSDKLATEPAANMLGPPPAIASGPGIATGVETTPKRKKEDFFFKQINSELRRN